MEDKLASLFESTLNTRALPTGDMRFIRSDFPRNITDDEVEWLRKNDVMTVVDLRGELEHEMGPCRLEKEDGFTFYLKLSGNTPTSTGSGMNRSCTA